MRSALWCVGVYAVCVALNYCVDVASGGEMRHALNFGYALMGPAGYLGAMLWEAWRGRP